MPRIALPPGFQEIPGENLMDRRIRIWNAKNAKRATEDKAWKETRKPTEPDADDVRRSLEQRVAELERIVKEDLAFIKEAILSGDIQ